MGKVVPLQNVYSNQWRLQQLVAIGELILKAELLFGSVHSDMDFAYREAIVLRATEFLAEANDRTDAYFHSQGLPAPERLRLPDRLQENQDG